jgi:hypothetical protein
MTKLLAAQRGKVSLIKVAIVAGNEWDKPKLVEFALHAISVNSIVFNDLATACIWLGVNAEQVGAVTEELRRRLRQGP